MVAMAQMIKTIFDKKAGDFLKIKPDNMRLNISAGQLYLKEAEFKAEIFDQLHLPFTLKGGFIDEMSVEMNTGSWLRGSHSAAAKIVVKNVFIVCGPHRTDWTWTHVQHCKTKLVDTVMKVYELKPAKKKPKAAGQGDNKGGMLAHAMHDMQKKILDDLKKKLLGMLEVHISNIHFRYEDVDTQELPFASGFKLGLVHITSKASHGDLRTTGDWRHATKVHADPFFNQCVVARRVSAYWDLAKERDSLFATRPVGGQEVRRNFLKLNVREIFSACVVEKILEMFPPQHKRRRFLEGPGFRERLDYHQYILFPFGFNAHVTVNNPTPTMKAQLAPLKDVDVIFEPVEVALDSEQLRSINELRSHEKEFRRRDQLIRTRPRESISESLAAYKNAMNKGHNKVRVKQLEQDRRAVVREWWHHAFQAVRLLCGIPKASFDEHDVKKKAELKKEYIDLCKQEMQSKEQDGGTDPQRAGMRPASFNCSSRLHDMQVLLPLQEILDWRLTAKHQYEEEKAAVGQAKPADDAMPEEEDAERQRLAAEEAKPMPDTIQARVHFRAFQAYFLIVADQLWRTAVTRNSGEGAESANTVAHGNSRRVNNWKHTRTKSLARQLVLRAQVIDVRMEFVQRGRSSRRIARWVECGVSAVKLINCNARKAQNSARSILQIQEFDKHGNTPLCIFVGATMVTVASKETDEADVPIQAMLEPSQGVSAHLQDFAPRDTEEVMKKLGFLQSHIHDVGKTMLFVFVRMGQVKAMDYTPFRRRMMHFIKRGHTELLTDLVRRPSPLALDRELLVKLQRKVQMLTGKSNMLGFVEGVIDGVRGRLVDHYNSQHVLCKEMSLAPMQWKALRSGCPQTFHVQFHQLQRPLSTDSTGTAGGPQPLPSVSLSKPGNPYGLLPWKMSMMLLPKSEFAMGLETATPAKESEGKPRTSKQQSDKFVNSSQAADMADPGTLVLAGGHFLKWGRNGKAKRRFVLFDDSIDAIVWKNVHTDKNALGAITMAKIQDISTGIQTPVLQKVVSPSIKADHVLSIISTDRTLDLQAESMAVRDRWLAGLKSRYKRYVQRQSLDGAEHIPLPAALERRLKTYPDKFKSDRCTLKSTYRKLQAVTALGKTWKSDDAPSRATSTENPGGDSLRGAAAQPR